MLSGLTRSDSDSSWFDDEASWMVYRRFGGRSVVRVNGRIGGVSGGCRGLLVGATLSVTFILDPR